MNSSFNTFIVEDEEESLKSLVRELSFYDKVIKIGTIAKSYEQARLIALTQKFDLSILDKNLDEGYTCFDLIKNSNISNFGIIALNSQNPTFSLDLLGLFKKLPTFILKPYNANNVGDFIKRLSEINIESGDEQIFLNAGHQGIIPVYKNSIAYIEAEGGYSIYHLTSPHDGKTKITVSGTLADQENKLNSRKFMRVHKSFIVNVVKIKKFLKGDTRTSGTLSLEGDYSVDYSKNSYNDIVERMNSIK